MEQPSTSANTDKPLSYRLEEPKKLTERLRKRTASGKITNTGQRIGQGTFLNERQPFDKKLFVETLEFVSKCENPRCDPMFRHYRSHMNMCDRCMPRLIELHHRLIFNEDLADLYDHAYKAFEYVAQIALKLDSNDSTKDKRAISFMHMQQMIDLVSNFIKHVSMIPDANCEMLQRCSQITFLVFDTTTTSIMGFGDCQVVNCYNAREVMATMRVNSYDPQTFKSIELSDETIHYCICEYHAYGFHSIHRLRHTFYNAYQNFCYWIERNKEELHKSFDSKLKMEFPASFNDGEQSSTFFGVDRELLENFTDSFVGLFTELDSKSRLTEEPIFSGIWISRLILLKSKKLLVLAQKWAPQLLKDIDEKRAEHNFSKKTQLHHLIYKDPD